MKRPARTGVVAFGHASPAFVDMRSGGARDLQLIETEPAVRIGSAKALADLGTGGSGHRRIWAPADLVSRETDRYRTAARQKACVHAGQGSILVGHQRC